MTNVGNISAAHPVTVPANGSVTLPDATNAPGVTEPTVQMTDTNVNQNACAHTTYTLTYGNHA